MKRSQIAPKCATCVCWIESEDDDAVGQCVLNPPTVQIITVIGPRTPANPTGVVNQPARIFPNMARDEFCAGHQDWGNVEPAKNVH